jgi:hypothetical protein
MMSAGGAAMTRLRRRDPAASPSAEAAEQQPKIHVRTYAFGVFIAAALLYGFLVTFTYSGDDLQYASLIQHYATGQTFYYPTGSQPYLAGRATLDQLPLNPRYLLEWPTSLLAAKIAYAANWSGNVIAPIQTLRILVGAFGLSMFFLAIVRIVSNVPIGLLATAGLGFTVSYLTYSTHTDQSINMVAILCLAFAIFVHQTQSGFTRRGLLLLIVVLALATLYNLTAVIGVFAFGVGVALFSAHTTLLGRLRTLITFVIAYSAVVAAIIAAAIAIFARPASLIDPAFWRDASFAGRPDYLVDPVHDAVRAAFGLGKSEILLPGVYGPLNDYIENAASAARLLAIGYYGVVLLVLISPFVLFALRPRNIGRNGKFVVVLVIWFLAHALFNWFWDPGYNKYWLMPMVCCWAMFALALDRLHTMPKRYYRLAVLGLSAFVCSSFAVNLSSQFWPDSRAESNELLTSATRMGAQSQPADLFLSPGHPMDFYISYFGHRDILSAELAALSSGNDGAGTENAFESRIAAHIADKGAIYVYGLEALGDEDRTTFVRLLGNGTLTEKWVLQGTTVYQWNVNPCDGTKEHCP